jgi:predicted transcriptional regulator of viral defense system
MPLELPDKTFITPVDLRKRYGDFDPNIWSLWEQQGRIIKLRNGLYMKGDHQLHGSWDAFSIAYQLYTPSYVSLWSAFRLYNLIPESVFEITSVSTREAKEFFVGYSFHSFRKIQASHFFGYKIEKWRGNHFAIAYLEKAILDMAHLIEDFTDAGYVEEMRFDEDVLNEDVSWDRMEKYLRLYDLPRLTKSIEVIRAVYDI